MAGDSGPVQGVPAFMPPGVSASMPMGGPQGGRAYAHTWAAALAPAQRPWLLLAIIAVVGIGTAAIIGLTGPTIEASTSPVPLPSASEAAPTAAAPAAATPAATPASTAAASKSEP